MGHWTQKRFCRLTPLNLHSANSLVFVLWDFTLNVATFHPAGSRCIRKWVEFWIANVDVFLAELLKMAPEIPLNINIKEPRWDQNTFLGRAYHFFTVTDPRNILLSNTQLENARKIVHDYRYDIDYFYYLPQKVQVNDKWYI